METHPLISKPKAGQRPAFWWRSFPMKLFGNVTLSFYLCLAAAASMCGSGFVVQQNGYILTNNHTVVCSNHAGFGSSLRADLRAVHESKIGWNF